MVRICRGGVENPPVTPCRFTKLRSSSPAPTRSISETAISDTTRAARARPRVWLAEPVRPPSLIVEFKSARALSSAGASPDRTPVSIETTNMKPSARKSSRTKSMNGRLPGFQARTSAMPPHASASPAAPPRRAISRLSVSNWRTKRLRPAPRLIRSAISRSRRVARASIRLVTLTTAISSTNPTAPAATGQTADDPAEVRAPIARRPPHPNGTAMAASSRTCSGPN